MSFSVALDGPSASGKSTVAKLIAKQLGLVHIDTGAMYRAVTYLCILNGVDPKDETKAVGLLPKANIRLTPDGKVFLNEQDISKEIRTNAVSDNVSYIASYKEVRLFLIVKQREMAKTQSVVMDGRDIGTYVLPDADVKIYQVASVETRAKRRYEENVSKNITTSYDDVLSNLKKRDYIDSHRSFDPLMPAPDAVILDTSDLSIEQVVEACVNIINKKIGKKA